MVDPIRGMTPMTPIRPGGIQPGQGVQAGQQQPTQRQQRPGGRTGGMNATNGMDTLNVSRQAVRANRGEPTGMERTEQNYPVRTRQMAVEANEPPPPPPPAQVPEVMQEFAPAQATGQAVNFYA